MDLEPIDLAFARKDHDVGVGRGDKQVLDEILILGLHPGLPFATAPLRPVKRDGVAFDITGMGNGDNHIFFDDQIFKGEIGRHPDDLRSALIGKPLFDIDQLPFDDFHDLDVAGQYRLETGDQSQDFIVLIDNPVALKTGQAMQAHIEDRLSLNLGQLELNNQLCFRLG